jgi:hypothetical protein
LETSSWQQELHFLGKLEGQMHQKDFPANDPVLVRVKEARAAIVSSAEGN